MPRKFRIPAVKRRRITSGATSCPPAVLAWPRPPFAYDLLQYRCTLTLRSRQSNRWNARSRSPVLLHAGPQLGTLRGIGESAVKGRGPRRCSIRAEDGFRILGRSRRGSLRVLRCSRDPWGAQPPFARMSAIEFGASRSIGPAVVASVKFNPFRRVSERLRRRR